MAWDNTPNHTNTTQHQQLRKWAHTNLAYICNTPGCHETKHLELDHIQNWKSGGQHSQDNIQWLCKHHHNIKTQKEATVARNAWKRKPEQHPGLI